MPRKEAGKAATKKVTKSASSKDLVKSKKAPSKAKTGKTKVAKADNNSQKEVTKVATKPVKIQSKDHEFVIQLLRLVINSDTSSKTKVPAKKVATRTRKKVTSPILEYYDLPYRYNETVVKLLAQTPNTLFVYWDIADSDRNRLSEQYGPDFFQNTKPVLVIHNLTKQYSFEIEINDFANSWYLHVDDAKCDYQIELGRRPRNAYVHLPNDYLYLTTSNHLESPNDHILLECLPNMFTFRNVKTGQLSYRPANSILTSSGKRISIFDLYKMLYGKELAYHQSYFDLSNPSSMPSSSFR